MAADYSIDIPSGGRRAGVWTIAGLFAGESFLRALNVSVIPIQAYDLLGTSQRVSMIATLVSFTVLCITLMLPFVLRGIKRRWVYTLGVVLIMMAAAFFMMNRVESQVAAMLCRNIGAAILNITLSLYIMDNIAKTEMTRSEPLRMTISTVSWVLGPFIGTWLYSHYGVIVPQLAVLGAGLLLLVGFWAVRLRDPESLPSGTLQAFNPISNFFTFFKQPRLRLAWSIAFGRSCFWSALFIYGPLLMLEGGLTKATAGFIISASQLTLPLSLIHGRMARAFGVRVVIASSFLGIAIFCLGAGYFGRHEPWFAVAFLLLASICASGLDGVGGIPFYRAVKPRNRQRMTSVYRSFFELAELIPGFVFMFLLLMLETSIVFIVIATLSVFLCAIAWKHLPKSM
jgi:MFS family permease